MHAPPAAAGGTSVLSATKDRGKKRRKERTELTRTALRNSMASKKQAQNSLEQARLSHDISRGCGNSRSKSAMDRDILGRDVSARKGLIAVSTGVIANHDRLMTVADLSAVLQVKPSTVYAWSSAGFCPVVKLGSAVRFSRPAIEAWLRSKSRSGRVRRRLEIEIEDPSKRRSKPETRTSNTTSNPT